MFLALSGAGKTVAVNSDVCFLIGTKEAINAPCHEDITVLGQLKAKVITNTHNAFVEL